MKTFITGDRSLGPLYPALVAVQMIKLASLGVKIVTGENTGVEQLVRSYGALAGLDIEVAAGGKAEFDERHAALAADNIPVILIHSDPAESSVYASVARTAFPDDDVRLVTLADLVV